MMPRVTEAGLGSRPMGIGLFVPHWTGQLAGDTPRWADTLAFASEAEAAGFDSLWVADDLFHREPEGPPLGQWECWSLLSALAATTSRVQIGSLVSVVGFRSPAMLAKIADTVDEISGGRLILGIGAGGWEDEHTAFGFPWQDRFGRLEEALIIIRSLLTTGRADFKGRFYEVRDCELLPRGPRPDGPPIMLGTSGSGLRMQRLTARYADVWNGLLGYGSPGTPSMIPPLRTALDAACKKMGRRPDSLERTVSVGIALPGHTLTHGPTDLTEWALTGSTEELASALRAFASEGISHVQISLAPCDPSGIAEFTPVLEELRRE